MTSNRDEPTQAEKRAILRQERSFNTLHGRAIADTNELGGRYAKVTEQRVVGSTPVVYPTLPANNPWASDPVGPEPLIDARDCGTTLGYEIDERVSTSAASEVRDAGAGEVAPNDGLVEATPAPSTLSAEAEAERKAALADRMLQIKGMSAPEEEASSPLVAAREPASLSVHGGVGSLSSKRTIRRRR
jgi:hypothetical protein